MLRECEGGEPTAVSERAMVYSGNGIREYYVGEVTATAECHLAYPSYGIREDHGDEPSAATAHFYVNITQSGRKCEGS